MTCFWTGILQSLDETDFEYLGDFLPNKQYLSTDTIQKFILLLKNNAKYIENVKWNDEELSEKQINENYDAIHEYCLEKVYFGYDCSTFDPFLFLVAEIFAINIEHSYNNTKIFYNHSSPRKTLKFGSDLGHFWKI